MVTAGTEDDYNSNNNDPLLDQTETSDLSSLDGDRLDFVVDPTESHTGGTEDTYAYSGGLIENVPGQNAAGESSHVSDLDDTESSENNNNNNNSHNATNGPAPTVVVTTVVPGEPHQRTISYTTKTKGCIRRGGRRRIKSFDSFATHGSEDTLVQEVAQETGRSPPSRAKSFESSVCSVLEQ